MGFLLENVMAGSNGGERPVKMSLDGADRKISDSCDLREFQLFYKPENKDGPLAV